MCECKIAEKLVELRTSKGVTQEDVAQSLKLIWKQELTINGEKRVLYYSRPSHKLLAVLLMTREIGYKGAYSL